ncbi:MAG: hypothetical protein RLZZ08_353 [Pseudomonadota bacterium]|jgi:cytochrome b561
MIQNNHPTRYSTASIVLHWLMLVVLVAVYATMELRGIFPRGSASREAMKDVHYMLGLSVLLLLAVRVFFRLTRPAPAPLAGEPAWRSLSAKAVHLGLYALMLGMPLAGWMILSAEGDPIPFFGLHVPALIGPNEGLAHQIEELHEAGGTIGYLLVAVHAAGALFHHYVLRDGLLDRMRGRG